MVKTNKPAKEEDVKVPPVVEEQNDGDDTVSVPVSVLADMQKQITQLSKQVIEANATAASALNSTQELRSTIPGVGGEEYEEAAPGVAVPKVAEVKKHKVVMKKFFNPDAKENDWVVAWSDKGAYPVFNPVTRETTMFMDVLFLKESLKPKSDQRWMQINYIELLRSSSGFEVPVLETKKKEYETNTGEKIVVRKYDDKHGLVETDVAVNSTYTFDSIQYVLRLPDVAELVTVDSKFVNLPK